ncbi:TonB-dependent receptor [Lysobacter sp. S4-A87]|uniref:TonB-dependent receptor n=1 Tax=Lysobacter sp. S4-A87 TaxID=2925843 RepID=UPI001F533022|nr:TonB-dependent receptor [Lysobacter sp. S4-A87]UNK50768.1 TonB-dependent receptor [Lysobacter sp. S4-A87]
MPSPFPSSSRLCAAIPAALACALPFVARADDAANADATTLDRIEVAASNHPLDASAAAGTRLKLSLQQTPASITVVDRKTMDDRGVRNTQEALFGIPGLAVASPPGNGNAVTWRGFSGAQIAQLFNGIGVQYDAIAARPVDGWIYERVEAIGGPSSFLHGAGAVGGSINYVSRLARLDRDSTQLLATAGSFGSGMLAGGTNQRIGGEDAHNAIRADAAWSHTDGWADRNQREATTLALSWLDQLTGNLSHTLALEYQDEDSERPYWGTPTYRDDGTLRMVDGTRTSNYNVADGHYGQQVLWARSLLEWQVSDQTGVRNTLYHYDALRDYRNVESYRLTPDRHGVIRSGALLQRHDQQLFGDRVEWSHEGTLATLPTQWSAGLDVSYNRQTRFPLSLPGVVDTVPLAAVTPGSFFDVPGAGQVYRPDRTNRLHTQALFVENLTHLNPRLSLLTGLRHDRIDLDVVNHRAASATNPARFQHDYAPTTGRIALDYAWTPALSTYIQVATSADPPAGILTTANFATLRDFDLSTGRQEEIGAKFQSGDGCRFATLAAYHIVRENLAVTDPANPGQTLPVGQQSSRGVELAFGIKPLQGLSIDGNLAWVDATLDDFYESVGGVPVSRAGNRPTNTPSRVANLWLDYLIAPQWSAGLDLRALSSRYADTANTTRAAGYGVLGAHLRWQVDPATSVTVRGRNLADRDVITYALSTDMVYLGEPRSWELELRREF